MNYFIFFFLLFLLSFKNTYAYDDVYESNFMHIDINEDIISDAKINEINKVKILSLKEILEDILTKENYRYLNRKIDLSIEIDSLIKNINIEDEFISTNKYSANIKINFDKYEIIKFLRKYKISYSDFQSEQLLLIATEKGNLIKEGLSKNNSFYNSFKIRKKGLLEFKFPELTLNDRFILPYNDIKNKKLDNFNIISNKYDVKYLVILEIENNHKVELNIYSLTKNDIIFKSSFIKEKKIDYEDEIINILDKWWKEYNIIDHSIIKKDICYIKNSNIHELYYIISKINSISQLKLFILKQINVGLNLYEIFFYGEDLNFYSKLSKYQIMKNINSKNECILSIKS